MNYRESLVLSMVLSIGLIADPLSTIKAEAKTPEYDAEGEQASIAVQVADAIEKQMELEPEKRIPVSIGEAAKCIAVFPNVIEFGFIVAGKGGPGIVSCREKESGEWGPPAIYKLSAASVGLQAGVQSASIILLYLKDEAVNSLKGSEASFGAGIRRRARQRFSGQRSPALRRSPGGPCPLFARVNQSAWG